MKSALLALLLLASPAFIHAQSPLLGNVPGRTSVSLNGTWRIIVDPYETGLSERYYENRKPRDKSDMVQYDFDASETLNVPGDWNTQKDKLFFYEGPIWHKKSFSYDSKPNTRVFLYFGAANYQARVYLNGEKLGEHEGGFTPFDFEITGKVRSGENVLVVEVNNARREDGVPSVNTDWWNYGGLTRDVRLVEVPRVFVRNYFVQLAKGSQTEIAGWVQLDRASQPQQVTIEIPEAGAKKTATTDAAGRAEFRFPARLQLWSPDNPKLYEVVISAAGDTVRDTIGFRSVEARGREILLNGKPIFLRGISMHEEAPYRGGRAFSVDDAQTLLGWVKELGCNFVRLAHYPHNKNEVRLADRMGLLVWSEIPVYWDIDWDNPATLTNAKAQLRDMIARDHNRASVVFWSMSNETPIKPERLAFLKQLAEAARQQDPTRLITSAMNHVERPNPELHVLNDPLGQYLDVLGLNEYIGWYEGPIADADRIKWQVGYDKPVVVSEFGADALYNHHGDADTRWTEEYQASLFEHQIRMVQKIPGFAGLSPWILMDFHSPRRPLPRIQDYYNRKGVISNRGERKQAFYVLQKFYREVAKGNDPAGDTGASK
jgi:beta-glucuronidase